MNISLYQPNQTKPNENGAKQAMLLSSTFFVFFQFECELMVNEKAGITIEFVSGFGSVLFDSILFGILFNWILNAESGFREIEDLNSKG